MKRVVLIIAAVVSFVLGWYLYQRSNRSSADARPNVLLIVVDTLRADHLGAYGHGAPTSPNVDRLAATGVLFEQAYAHVPQTLPSFTSILTGTYPTTHGVRSNGVFAVRPDALTLAEILKPYGYRTGAVIAGFPIESRFGLNQGFDDYMDEFQWDVPLSGVQRNADGTRIWNGHELRNFESSAEQVTDDALAWLENAEQSPFFLMVHYFDPHLDYRPPPELAARFAHPYDAEIATMDRSLGRLLSNLERAATRPTLVLFTADHGECLGEHGRVNHFAYVTEATVHVPLVMKFPGRLPEGKRIRGLARSVDIVPTVLELVDVPAPETLEGQSLVGSISTGRTGIDSAYFETLYGLLEGESGWSIRGFTDGRYKLKQFTRENASGERTDHFYWLYDLSSDPDELTNLLEQDPGRLGPMQVQLQRFLDSHPSRPARGMAPDPEAMERLKSLGYL